MGQCSPGLTNNMPPLPLLERIARAPILCDGAMKTQLMERSFERGLIPEREMSFSTGYWNVEHPEIVEAVHRDYLEAGAELILTNTFKAGVYHVMRLGRASSLAAAASESDRLLEAATQIARRACGNDAWVLADIGSIGQMSEMHGGERSLLREEFVRQARVMHDAGADALIIEYVWEPIEMVLAVEAAKSVADWPVIATPVFANWSYPDRGDYRTHRVAPEIDSAGVTIDEMIRAAVDAGADVVGAHCGVLDLADYTEIAGRILESPNRPEHIPVMIQPNGSETARPLDAEQGRSRPEALATWVPRLLDLGVRVLGGCCGTTPQDIRAMAGAASRE